MAKAVARAVIISKTQSSAGNQSNDITNVSLVMGLF